MRRPSLLLACSLLALTHFASAQAPPAAASSGPDTCAPLGRGTKVGNSDLVFSQLVTNGSFTAPGGQRLTDLPAFCRVVAVASAAPGSNILIEIWLPVGSAWNGKIMGTGNGSFAGSISYAALAGGVKRGYAVANTDMGTAPAGSPGVGYQAGNGRPDAWKDWGYRATHEMALVSASVVQTYYSRKPDERYFVGCSTGGHQALTEAQRFPDDYDAIIAGAPGNNRTHLHAMFAWITKAAATPGSAMSSQQIALLTDSVKKACLAKDGGAPADTFFTDPTQCTFDPKGLLCKAGQDEKECLQQPQIDALNMIYTGTRDPRTGHLIYPPEVRGNEQQFGRTLGATGVRAQPSTDLSRWVFGPKWDGSTFDFDKDMAKEDEVLGKDINALDSDLTKFAAHGGKLILFHGWADTTVSPVDTIVYYDRITAKGKQKGDFVRLFMAPGMSHCQNGPGPNLFSQTAEEPMPDGQDNDLIGALDSWVKTGLAPESILAKKFENDGRARPAPGAANGFGGGAAARGPNGTPAAPEPKPEMKVLATRTLCAYPKIAKYNGSGDATQASSFACSDAPPAKYEKPAPEYLK